MRCKDGKNKALDLFLETSQIDNTSLSFNSILDSSETMSNIPGLFISGLFQAMQNIHNINANKEMTIEEIRSKKEIALKTIETKHIETMARINNNHEERKKFIETCMYTVRESIERDNIDIAIEIIKTMSEFLTNNKEE